ncbi:MAG: hypothetical protein KH615_09860, partial [Clostridiales bacterium]|nr:hypothetical protein [Clostridiales bacterium]
YNRHRQCYTDRGGPMGLFFHELFSPILQNLVLIKLLTNLSAKKSSNILILQITFIGSTAL